MRLIFAGLFILSPVSLVAIASPADLPPLATCPAQTSQACEALHREIDRLWAQSLSLEAGSLSQSQVRLAVNQKLEQYQLLVADADTAVNRAQIASKYAALQGFLSSTPHTDGGEGIWRNHQTVNVAYHPLEWQAVQDVYKNYGTLVLDVRDIAALGQQHWMSYTTKRMPWAGYWYPKYDAILYAGADSVLAKVDRVLKRKGRSSQAQAEESDAIGKLLPESWEGLCNAWSLAAALIPEPTAPIQAEGEVFSIAEQKALLTKMHENYPVAMYGSRYNGDITTDGSYQDLRPEAFHRLVLSIIGQLKKVMIIDDAAGPEVWQEPVFRVDWNMQEDPNLKDAYLVKAQIWKIKPRWSISEELTSKRDYSIYDYHYRLYVDPAIKASTGEIRVVAGEWLESSRETHPDYVIAPRPLGAPSSFNPSLQGNMDDLKQIFMKDVGDFAW